MNEPSMSAEVKADWLEELRSDHYRQIKGGYGFNDDDGTKCRCAIGVLLFDVLGVPLNVSDEHEFNSLSQALSGPEQGIIQSLNDREGLTFDEIADRIEQDVVCT